MEKDSSIAVQAKQLRTLSREEDITSVQGVVSKHIHHLTAAALAAALGGTMVLKLQMSDTGKMKYIPLGNEEEILQALEWIAQFGNDSMGDGEGGGFFVLQQRPPDAKFWDALTTRHLGKIPDEAKKAESDKLNLAKVGKKALERSKPAQDKIRDPIPSSWS